MIGLMSIDVEDWFQTASFKGIIDRPKWDDHTLRVERNTDLILEILAEQNIKGTFFILGWIAERVPQLVRRIQEQGHEVACHGYNHDCLYDLTPEVFREDIRSSKALLEDIAGTEVIGYRAPNFSITDWAVHILKEEGFTYDSSLFPSLLHDRYGKLNEFQLQDKPLFELTEGFHEFSMMCAPLLKKNIPWAGGGYFRLLPYPIFKRGIRRILSHYGVYNFYIHPWEFDPGQPRHREGMSRSNLFRHYNSLNKTEARFRKMVKDFPFTNMRDYLNGNANGQPSQSIPNSE